jgi:hypothetical protein
LAHLQWIGIGGGLGAALLVGGVCHHSHRLCELVGGLSQRLVLNSRAATHIMSGQLEFGFAKKIRDVLWNDEALPFRDSSGLLLAAGAVKDD